LWFCGGRLGSVVARVSSGSYGIAVCHANMDWHQLVLRRWQWLDAAHHACFRTRLMPCFVYLVFIRNTCVLAGQIFLQSDVYKFAALCIHSSASAVAFLPICSLFLAGPVFLQSDVYNAVNPP
jgi:hypothetical protein